MCNNNSFSRHLRHIVQGSVPSVWWSPNECQNQILITTALESLTVAIILKSWSMLQLYIELWCDYIEIVRSNLTSSNHSLFEHGIVKLNEKDVYYISVQLLIYVNTS